MPSVAEAGAERAVDRAALLGALPPVPDTAGAAAAIAAHARRHRTKVVVIDDDPTGTQAVADVPVVTSADEQDLRWALAQDTRCLFVETDARALPEPAARTLNEALARKLARLAPEQGIEPRLISRSDSTLRGHFPAEPLALGEGLRHGGLPEPDLTVVCPAFLSAGRITIGDVHYLADGERYLPVAQTEFARDATFGYRHSDLRAWVRERAGERARVNSLGIDELRLGGPAGVADRLRQLEPDSYLVVNAAAPQDLDVFVLGLLAAEDAGRGVLLRTAPSLAGHRAALAPRVTSDADLARRGRGRGLVVVGSHTAVTTRQLRVLLERHRMQVVELDATRLADPAASDGAIEAALREAGAALRRSDVALVTSRALLRADSPQASLALSRRVADGVADVVRRLDGEHALAWVVAKGGITSSEVARHGLGARRAWVLGQMFPGLVPVWRLERPGRRPLPYVVFPGNVGTDNSLAESVTRLKEAS
jgi:uncharacterized protein YgbK (DUF1537 family)